MLTIARSAAEGLISKLNTEFESKTGVKKERYHYHYGSIKRHNIQVRKEKYDFKFSIELGRSEVIAPGREHF